MITKHLIAVRLVSGLLVLDFGCSTSGTRLPGAAGASTGGGGSRARQGTAGATGSYSGTGGQAGNAGSSSSASGAGGASGAATLSGAGAGGAAQAGAAAGGSGGAAAQSERCIGENLLTSLGRKALLIGGADASSSGQAPMDVLYTYITGEYPADSIPCASCLDHCNTQWWGCWQSFSEPPGKGMVIDKCSGDLGAEWNGLPNPRIPMFTYYAELQMSNLPEGTAQVAALNDAAFMSHYLGDIRFLSQKIGKSQAFVQIEPDLWGYVMQVDSDPLRVPAAVGSVAPECASLGNNAAGAARCMMKLVRAYAPNAKVGLQISPWVTGFSNSDPGADVEAQAKSVARFMVALGAAEGDFVTTDPNSSGEAGDAGGGTPTFWDVNNVKLPNFHQAFAVSKVIAETIGRPLIWWQLPLGNLKLDNTPNHYQDVFLDYLFTHPDEVVSAHIVSLLFGPANSRRTNMDSDGGNFIAQLKAYASSGAQPYCP